MVELIHRRVVVLNHFASPKGSPGGTRHVELFGRLRGWDYVVVAARLNQLARVVQGDEPGFKTVWASAYSTNGWSRVLNWVSYAITATVWAMRYRRFDVVYASSPHLLAGLAGWLVSRLLGKPLILEVRDLWPQVLLDMGQLSERSLLYRSLTFLETFLYRRAATIVVMTAGVSQAIVRRGIPSSKVVLIPNGADPEDFQPKRDREELRTAYGFEKLTAVYAGAHGPANGLEYLLDAAAELAEQDLDIVLIGDGVQKPALRAEARRRRLDNLKFLDPVPKTAVPDLFHAADVGVHVLADASVFRYGVSPNKLFDYMAAGLPVVTNSAGLVAGLVTESKCGIVASSDGLASALMEMCKLSDRDRERLGKNGRSWITLHQSRSEMANRLEHCLDNMCNIQ